MSAIPGLLSIWMAVSRGMWISEGKRVNGELSVWVRAKEYLKFTLCLLEYSFSLFKNIFFTG